jgi:hypothetical protein
MANVGVKVHFGMPNELPLLEAEELVDNIVQAGIRTLHKEHKLPDGFTGAGTCHVFVRVDAVTCKEQNWTLGEAVSRKVADERARTDNVYHI